MYLKAEKFSLWADFIEREYLDGEFKNLINANIINGATSNPAIFKSAILTSPAYKEQLAGLSDLSSKERYEAVAIYDIQKAADILKEVHEKDPENGYVSIEVDPFLCDDAEATIAEGKRLFKSIDRENVMIKVPATEAGYIAMKELVSSNIPVNATLIFSEYQAKKCVEAFKDSEVSTVVSVFVSRIDRVLDEKLEKLGIDSAKAGVYNAANIYNMIESKGLKKCRTLFASTGVKGDSLHPAYYVDQLLASNSVNTAPIATIDAFVKNGDKQIKLPLQQDEVDKLFSDLEGAGIKFETILDELISDGLEQFKVAFNEILEEI